MNILDQQFLKLEIQSKIRLRVQHKNKSEITSGVDNGENFLKRLQIDNQNKLNLILKKNLNWKDLRWRVRLHL